MIERNKPRRRKPRLASRKPSNYRPFNSQHSNAPKSRGHITRTLEKYMNMAQDANSNGDRIVAENYFQYAEHYQRLLNDDNKGNIGVVQKKDSDDEKNVPENNVPEKNVSEKNVSEINDIKLSRTQRAINAKDERLNKQKDQKEETSSHTKEKGFTRDGLEALKPFQTG